MRRSFGMVLLAIGVASCGSSPDDDYGDDACAALPQLASACDPVAEEDERPTCDSDDCAWPCSRDEHCAEGYLCRYLCIDWRDEGPPGTYYALPICAEYEYRCHP
ncbi:MAG: hypothetical protein RIF41_24780 [Polyangiaceae bacterium]